MPSCQNPFASALQCVKEMPLWGQWAIAAGVGLSLAGVVLYKWRKSGKKSRRASPFVKEFEPGVVYLFQFPRISAVPNLSPFCLKLETWLRMAGVRYKCVENIPVSLRSREGTLPFVELNGVEYPDSNLAIAELTRLLNKQSMEDHMTGEQKAASRGMEMLVEGSILSTSAYFRLPHARQIMELFQPGLIPRLMVPYFARWWRGFIMNKLLAAGVAKHSEEDIRRIAEEDLLALSAYLGQKHYFTGFKPTRLDATAFSVLALILYMPIDTAQKKFIEEKCINLKEFCERAKERYWPDWDECTAQYRMNSKRMGKIDEPKPKEQKFETNF